jgi:uncharacterized protein YegL
MRTKLQKLLSLLLCLVMVAGMMPAVTFAAPANGATPPAVSKTLTPNGDGTYTLSLSVTGQASSVSESSKADVIVVLDTSGSMNEGEQYIYLKKATGRYGLVNGRYVSLYREHNSSYSKLDNDDFNGTVYYRTWNWTYSYHEYTGTRYIRQSGARLAVAKATIHSLAEQLLANNTDDPDRVRLSLVTFANYATTRVTGTSNLQTFQTAVNSLTADGGTNWEDGLHDANEIVTREGADVYVIFVSDGNPTYRNTQGDYYNYEDKEHGSPPNVYYGSGYSDNNGKNYNYAKDQAIAIVNAGKELFCIGVFGNVTNMQNLALQSGAGADNYYSAVNYDAIAAAFSNIICRITKNFCYKDIAFNDSITGMTSILVETDPTSFVYTRSGGAYGAGTPWDSAPPASYSGGAVSWNLGDMPLENGVTYTVSFKVWPSQAAYDLVADLNNGLKTYDSLTEDEKAQIVPLAGGGYGLNTNYDATLDYTQIETKITNTKPDGYNEGEEAADGYTYTYDSETGIYTGIKETPGTVPIVNPDPIELPNSVITVNKSWNDSLDNSQRPSSVTLVVKKDGSDYKDVVLNSGNNWTQQIYVAPGMTVNGTELETGHVYTVTEPEVGNPYETVNDGSELNPMLVNGVLTPASGAFTVTNNLKGRLSIKKTVTAEPGDTPPANTKFKIKVTFMKDGASWDGAANGATYSIVSTGGTASPVSMPDDGIIILKAEETAIIYNIATGVTYKVEELIDDLPADFTPSFSGDTGTIAANTMQQASITNNYNKQESGLVLKKTFYGDDIPTGDKNRITFTITGPVNFGPIYYSAFTNGTYDLGRVPPGEYTITESNADFVGYNRTTTISVGDEQDLSGKGPQDSVTCSVADGKTRTVEFKNTYTKLTSLTIKKVFDGDDVEKLTDAYKNAISFKVTGPTGFEETTITYDKFDEDDDGNINTYTFDNVPAGNYKVVETLPANPAGYKVQTGYSPENGEITLVKDAPGTVTVTNTYSKQVSNLTITKVFAGDLSGLNETYKNAISFTVTGPNNYTQTVTYGNFSGGNSHTFENVLVGEYTVAETLPETPAGYHVQTGYSHTDGKITLAEDVPGTVTVTNTYSKKVSNLIITKVFSGDLSGLNDDYKNAIRFTVTGPNNYTQTVTYGDFSGGSSHTFENVLVGTYTVTENNAALDGFNVQTEYSSENGEITLVENVPGTVTVTNTYSKQVASLTITKEFAGETGELNDDYKNAISFTVTGPNNYKCTVTYGQFSNKANNSHTIPNLPVGTYTVTENNAALGGYQVETTYSPGGGEIALTNGNEGTVTVTNTYNKLAASLTITKRFEGDTGELNYAYLSGISFRVESTAVGFSTLDLPYSRFTQYDGYMQCVLDVPPGTYTVKENLPAPPDRHNVQTGYSPDEDTFAAGGQITLMDDQSRELIITNTYDKQSASLTITKSFIGDTSELSNEYKNNITFTVTGPGFNKTVKYGSFSAGTSHTFGDLPPGVYTVTESGYNTIPGYVVTSSISNGTTFTLNDGDAKTVSVNNHYNKLAGNLTITKIFGGDPVDTTLDDIKKIEFTIKGLNSSYKKTVTYADFGGSNSYTLLDIPLDEYTVSESNANLSGYVVTTSYNPIDGKITLEHDNQSVEVRITNHYNKLEGGLVLQKTFKGDVLTEEQKADIKLTVYNSESQVLYEISYSQLSSGPCVLNLLPGTYTIVESGTHVDGYLCDTKYSTDVYPLGEPGSAGEVTKPGNTAVVEITDGNAHYVEFINTYDKQSAKLTITKVFQGDTKDLPAEYKDAITFSVYNSENTLKYYFRYSDFTEIEQNIIQHVIDDVPLGTYTVTETLPDEQYISDKYDYIVTTEYIPWIPTITLEDGDNPEVKIINTYNKQSAKLTIMKEFTGDTENLSEMYKNSITFTVTGPVGFEPQYITYSQFIDGQYVIDDVPPGIYTVTENLPADPEGYEVESLQNPAGGTIYLVDDIPGEVKITNKYNKPEGSLVLQKTFTGHSLTDAQKSGITFTVYNFLGEIQRQISYSEFQNGQYALNNLSPGVYSVVESCPDFEGYMRSGEYETISQPLSQVQPPVMSGRIPLPADNKVEIEIVDGNVHYVHFINNYKSTEAYLEVPFTKIVMLGGNVFPGIQTFELEVFGFDVGVDYQNVFRYAAVDTNGVGNYNGKLIISGYSNQVKDIVSKGFYVREKNTGAAYWTYSNEVWYVKSADDTELDLRIYPAAQLPNGYYDYSNVDNPAEKMTFTNIYTYNHSSYTPTPPDPSPAPSPYQSPDNVVYTASSWTLTLTKVDFNDNSYRLPGAKFDLYRVGSTIDTKVGSYITDSSGVAYATVSVSGDYYWVETQPPTGYTLDTTRRYTSTSVYGKSIVVENKKTETPTILNDKDHIAYVIGYPNGLVLPGGQITRGEVTTIFFRLLNEDVRNANYTKDNNFLDVNHGDWFNAAISTMAKMGIVKGYPDGNFRPNDPITRAEFVAIAARFDNSTVSTSADFGDVKGHWAEIEIGKVTANGWVNGYLDNTFKPDQNITRAEAMALINRVLNRNPETPYDLLDDMIKWPDNMDTTRWYYLDVQEATNSHDYMRKSNNTERWIKINPPRDWAALER